MGPYDGKKVVNTGGTSGMGLATAKMLLARGARVLVTGSTKKTLDSAREELGKNAIVMSSDARVLTDIDALAARAKSELGAVDFLGSGPPAEECRAN
jgi:NAD(P)-dependent dehydrogenase (short-subunit alcohol dehydrogenase family)